MPGLWFDYSEGRPSGAALKAAGAVGVMRYVGVGGSATLPGKRLIATELADLIAHGLIVLGVVESSTTRANAGRSAGISDAQAALADPVATTLPILFATNDEPTWSQSDVDYVAGFQAVIGRDRTGVYGYGAFLRACADGGLGSVYWQAGPAPSRTETADLAHFWQRQGGPAVAADGPATPATVMVGGVPCDPNNQLKELPTMALTADDITAIWEHPIPNPLYDPTAPANSGVKSVPTYKARELLAGAWSSVLATDADVNADDVPLGNLAMAVQQISTAVAGIGTGGVVLAGQYPVTGVLNIGTTTEEA